MDHAVPFHISNYPPSGFANPHLALADAKR